MGNHRLELAGKRFGRLLVLSDSGEVGDDGRVLWDCRCDCGTETLLPGSRLKRGHVQSCGCLANNNGNYEPGNCRWATNQEQIDNRRKFGRIETFSDEELMREVTRRALFDKKE